MGATSTQALARASAVLSRRRTAGLSHGVALVWFVIVALLVLAPALAHGATFGSFDLLHQFGLLHRHGVVVHNTQAGDQSDSIIPWAALSWIQVHQGHLPLWNPYGALGMPLAFNWQSASFSIPSLLGYLTPLSWALTLQVVITLVIAGSGVYAFSRVLGLSAVACIFGGTVFQLSGPMLGWLGWPHAAVLSWTGWLFAAALLILRGHTAVRNIAGLALVIAAMIYAGQPEILTLLALSLVIFSAVVVWCGVRRPGSNAYRRPLFSLSAGAVAGVALGAPLLLPGLQVIARSQHGAPGGDPGELVKGNPPLPAHNLVHIFLQGYDGLPVAGNHWFGYVGGYSETAAYVGVIPVVLAVLAMALRWRRPAVPALAAVTVVSLALAFVPAAGDALNHFPVVRTLVWQRAILPLAFSLAVLAGIGMDALVRDPLRTVTRRWLTGGFGVAGILLAGLWLFGQGHLSAADARTRRMSFVWAAAEIGVGLLVATLLIWVARSRGASSPAMSPPPTALGRLVALLLLACETAFLITAGGPLWTAESAPFVPTRTVAAFQHAVGTSIVGYGAPLCFFPPGLGIPPNAQVAFGVQELAAYDPALPSAYFSSWRALTGQPGGIPAISAYCPEITTVAMARLYGVGIVLESAGTPGPKGTSLLARIDGEDLYRVPDSGAATLAPLDFGTHDPTRLSAPSTPVAVIRPDPATWTMVTSTPKAATLRLRLTNLPGWHATVDGESVPLTPFAGVMLQLTVPPGRHRVQLTYWPAAFTQGLALAALAVLGLAGAYVGERVRRGRPDRSALLGPEDPDHSPHPEAEGVHA